MSSQLPSHNPTGYLGIAQTHPPQLHLQYTVPPATLHARNFGIGDLWVDISTNLIWMLTQMVNTAGPSGIINATWTSIAAAAGVSITRLGTNIGGVILPAAGLCNILGDGIAASGVLTTYTLPGNTMTISVQYANTGGNRGVSTYDAASFNVSGAGLVTLTGLPGFSWNAALAVQPMTQNTGYYTNVVGITDFILPAAAAAGSILWVQGAIAGGWTITEGVGQQIFSSNTIHTTATTGSCSSIDPMAGIELLCTTANLIWQVIGSKGNIKYL